MRWLKTIALVAGLLLLGAAPASATITTWNHADADSWSTAAAWDNGVPGANDTAVFDGTGAGICTVNTAGVCNRLVISHSTSVVAVDVGSSVTVGAGGFSFTDGDFDDGGTAVTVSGPISIVTPASYVSTGTLVEALTGTVVNATAANEAATWSVTNTASATAVIATRTGDVYCARLMIGPTDSIKGAFVTYLLPVVNNFIVDSGGTSTGGATDIYLTTNLSTVAASYVVSIDDSTRWHGHLETDTMTLGAALSVGDFVIDTATFVDAGESVSVAGNIYFGPAAVVTSTGTWTQTAKGTITGSYDDSIFDYTTAIADTAFFAALAADDTVHVSSSFNFTGTAGSSALMGASGVVTNIDLPDTATISNVELSDLNHVGATKLKAYGNFPRGHLSRIACRK